MSHPSYYGMIISVFSLIAVAVGTTVDFDSLSLRPHETVVDDADFYKAPSVQDNRERSPSWLAAFGDESEKRSPATGEGTVLNSNGSSTTIITRDGKEVGRVTFTPKDGSPVRNQPVFYRPSGEPSKKSPAVQQKPRKSVTSTSKRSTAGQVRATESHSQSRSSNINGRSYYQSPTVNRFAYQPKKIWREDSNRTSTASGTSTHRYIGPRNNTYHQSAFQQARNKSGSPYLDNVSSYFSRSNVFSHSIDQSSLQWRKLDLDSRRMTGRSISTYGSRIGHQLQSDGTSRLWTGRGISSNGVRSQSKYRPQPRSKFWSTGSALSRTANGGYVASNLAGRQSIGPTFPAKVKASGFRYKSPFETTDRNTTQQRIIRGTR